MTSSRGGQHHGIPLADHFTAMYSGLRMIGSGDVVNSPYRLVLLACTLSASAWISLVASAQCGSCPPGGIDEGEPGCGPSPDTINGGCLDPYQYPNDPYYGLHIQVGDTVCGTTGNWDS